MSMKTQEKMIINFIQYLVQTGIKVLCDFIREISLEFYERTERKLKFKNNGLLYIIRLFEKDVGKLLSI